MFSTVRGAGRLASNALLACCYFVIIAVRPSRRSHYGQQFLYKTEGGTFERAFAAFEQTEAGARLLATAPDSVALLRERAALQALPPGSLGYAYGDFMVRSEIDEDLYLAGAVEAGLRFERDPRRRWFRTRVEAGHDLRHVLTDYGIDPLGETCLMAFRFGQTRHVGAFVIAAVREAYRRGRAAQLLDLLPWEELMATPLAAVQQAAGLETPRRYPPVGTPAERGRPVLEAAA